MNENPLEITLTHAETPPQLAACLAVRQAVFTVGSGAFLSPLNGTSTTAWRQDTTIFWPGSARRKPQHCAATGRAAMWYCSGSVCWLRFAVMASAGRYWHNWNGSMPGRLTTWCWMPNARRKGFTPPADTATVSGVFEEAGVKHVRMEKLL